MNISDIRRLTIRNFLFHQGFHYFHSILTTFLETAKTQEKLCNAGG